MGETATDTFTYTVSDGHGGTATNTLTVTINGTNDAPTIGASTASVTEDTLLTATGSVPVPRDPDVHDVLSIQPMSNVAGTYGTLTLRRRHLTLPSTTACPPYRPSARGKGSLTYSPIPSGTTTALRAPIP
ncbi:MAG: VCBS domain-containing protein [Bilophila wadsworthia]